MVATDDERGRIAASLQGDHEAFESLVKEYQRMIHAVCFRMTGSMAEAEDLAQETFVQAYQHLDSFRGEARFSSWLYRIAMNQCLNWQKQQQRRERVHADFAEQGGGEAPERDPRTALIADALLKLPPKQRAAVILTSYEGLNHAQAAKALACSEATISWRVFAARAKLKKLLAPWEGK